MCKDRPQPRMGILEEMTIENLRAFTPDIVVVPSICLRGELAETPFSQNFPYEKDLHLY